MPAETPSTPPAVRVLGPVEVDGTDGLPHAPRGARAAALVAALAVADGAPVTVSRLVDALWPDEVPADPRAALHSLVSRLRQVAADGVVVSGPAGYALGGDSDLALARRELAAGRALLADGRPGDAGRCAAAALALWRGEPGVEYGAIDGELREAAGRLRDELAVLRREAAEAGGDHATVVELASRALADDSLDEDAARSLMTSLAAQGRDQEAVRVYGRLRHALVAELGTDPAPDLVALHERLAAAPPREATPARHLALGLRAAPNPLLGRDGDVAAVESALAASRLVTVLGAGGLGKTRLAQEVARRAVAATPLVVVVELAGVRADDDVAQALADALGLSAGQSARLGDLLLVGDLRAQVLARLRDVRALVVLDNCEHVAEGAARWASDLLAAVPGLRILATSRAPLRLGAEQTYPLAPLAAHGEEPDRAGPAAELFRQRARAARADVRLPDDVVARLCDRLDGLPLAIELAAARVRSLSVEDIEQHLDARFALLRSGDAAAPDRHRTLEAVIEWSWNLLTASQQALWRRVAVLPDGFGLDAAVAVGGLGTGSPLDALDDIEGLATQSLLAVADADGVARYRMLETVREFGLLRLADAGEQEVVRDALLDWAAQLSRRDVVALLGPGQVAAVAELTRDQENLLFAFRTAADASGHGARARRPDVVVLTFVGLAASWMLLGSEERAAGLVGTVLGAVRGWAVPDGDAEVTAVALALAFGAAAIGGAEAGGLAGRARALARLRVLLRREEMGRRTRTLMSLVPLTDRTAMAGPLRELRDDPDPLVAFVACIASGQEAENDGRLEQALLDAHRAYELSAAIGDVACPTFAAMFVAMTASELGDFATATAWTARVRPGFTALGATGALRQLDWIELSAALDSGDVVRARAICDVLEAGGEWPDERGEAQMRAEAGVGRAEIALLSGDVETAVARYAQVVGTFEDVPSPSAVWAVMLCSAQVVRLAGLSRLDEARAAMVSLGRRAARLYRDWMPQFLDRPVLGTACLAAGTYRAAAGDRDPEVADLFAVAEAIGSRQDFPALSRAPLLESAASLLGGQALAQGRARVAALTHDGATERALALLDAVGREDERA